jgi:hypothetical protein
MSKYNKFVVYKIYQPKYPELIYIGSTTNFSSRKSNHKKYCKNRVSKKYHYPLYKYIRNCGGFETFNMEIIEEYPCKTKNEGLQREKELIELHNAKLNTNCPIRN